jgi:hypothetical protein
LEFVYNAGNTVEEVITVSALNDDDDESTIHTGTITFSTDNTKYVGAIDTESVDIIDNDGASGGSVTGTVIFWQSSGGVTPNLVNREFTATTSSKSEPVSTDEFGRVDLTAYVAQVISLETSIENETEYSGIEIGDAVTILKHIVGLTSLTGSARVAADVNGDGDVTIADAVLTLKTIVGLEDSATLVAVDSSGRADLTVTGPTMDLTAVVLGDVDGSYADII